MLFAIVINGIVENIIELEQVSDYSGDKSKLVNANGKEPQIGRGFANGTFEGLPMPVNPPAGGGEIEGIFCSVTDEDLWNLAGMKDWIMAGNAVDFRFQNGNTLNLNTGNIAAFEALWFPFRLGVESRAH